MFTREKTYICAVLVATLILLNGCGYTQPSYVNRKHSINLAWAKERLTPRPLKRDLFKIATATNQKLENEPIEVTLRELRNGTLELRRTERELNPELYNAENDNSSYGKGFNDGCKSFMSIVGASTYRLIKHRIFPQLLTQDMEYERGYQDGAAFCSHRTAYGSH